MTHAPIAKDALLAAPALADALSSAGFPVTKGTLAMMRSRGNGPPARRWGGRVLYVWSEALAWAESRLSDPSPRPPRLNEMRDRAA